MRFTAFVYFAFWSFATSVYASDHPPADDSPPIDGISFRYVESNGISIRIAEAGTGPTVLMAHGFPESWFSWRHQLKALAAAGFHAVAPDMRGYGLTSAPLDAEDYVLDVLAADMVGILDALDVEQAHMAGHDWGSPVASGTVVRYPDRFKSLTLMSVPYRGRGPSPPLDGMKKAFGDNFFYMLYHNEPGGVAEAEYEANTREFLFTIYQSPTSPRKPPVITDPKRAAGGWIGRMGEPLGLPGWLSEAELDYYVKQFDRSGFHGGINYYRTLNQNWEAAANIADPVIRVPTLFIAGDQDMVIAGANAQQIRASMEPVAPNLTIRLFPGIGHWVQQEAAVDTNAAWLKFLNALPR